MLNLSLGGDRTIRAAPSVYDSVGGHTGMITRIVILTTELMTLLDDSPGVAVIA
jgi:hypothetical protein